MINHLLKICRTWIYIVRPLVQICQRQAEAAEPVCRTSSDVRAGIQEWGLCTSAALCRQTDENNSR